MTGQEPGIPGKGDVSCGARYGERMAATRLPHRAGAALVSVLVMLGLAAGLLVVAPAAARADTPVAYGYDISWPQCPVGTGTDVGGGYGVGQGNPMPPATAGFVVIGLTAGLPFTRNPCLADQVRFALSNGIPRGVYTMAAYPTSAQLTTYGISGPAAATTLQGRLFNTGYAMARYDLQTLAGVGLSVPFVWIDVESRKVQNWPTGTTTATADNQAVLSGYAKGFQDARLRTGWYSYRTGWAAITGGWQDGAPMWKAGDYTADGFAGALSICSTPSLNGGPIWMGQRVWYDPAVAGYRDLDATCLPLPSMVTIFDGAVPPSVSAVVPGAPAVAPGTRVAFRTTLGTSQIWDAALTDACTGTQLATWSGIAKGTITIVWDGLDASGATAQTGLYRMTVSSSGITRSGVVELSTPGTTVLGSCGLTRTYGADRYATSVAIGRTAAPLGQTVVLAPGEPAHLVDGLVAAPLARQLGAPLLLSGTTTLPAPVRTDITSRGATTAYLVGGTASLSAAVVGELKTLGVTTVVRVAGTDRYATSVAVATTLKKAGGVTDGVAWVASGADANLVDALAAGGPAAAAGEPILLTAPTVLPASVRAALTALAVTSTKVPGGTAAVSAAVLAQLPAPVRLAGADRYATAVAVAQQAGPASAAVLASGLSMVDALPGGTLGLPTVLTAGSTLPASTAGWLATANPAMTTVLGGPGVVPPSVLALVVP